MYQIDGKETPYGEVMTEVLNALFEHKSVHYAFHWGVDIMWINTPAPYWADRVTLTYEGLEAGNKLIEPLSSSDPDPWEGTSWNLL